MIFFSDELELLVDYITLIDEERILIKNNKKTVTKKLPSGRLLSNLKTMGKKVLFYFFNKSLISDSNFSSLVGSGGGGVGATASFFFKLFMALINRKIVKATIKKSIVVCKKVP
jgi:hypothetical protein